MNACLSYSEIAVLERPKDGRLAASALDPLAGLFEEVLQALDCVRVWLWQIAYGVVQIECDVGTEPEVLGMAKSRPIIFDLSQR